MSADEKNQNNQDPKPKKIVTQIDYDKIDKLEQSAKAEGEIAPSMDPVLQNAAPEEDVSPGMRPQAEEPAGPEFIPVGSGIMFQKKTRKKIKWAILIPALAVVLCLGLFSIASYAGWIQTFLTPESKLVKEETTTEPETTTEEETTTTEPETTTTETTTEETTTEFIPSYYIIDVNLAYNIVTVYVRGEKYSDGWDPSGPLDDEYDRSPVIAFTCSPGVGGATPTGRYYLQDRAAWCLMIGDVYTQYATRIVDDVMFHSIPYYTQNPGDIETYQYNILGYEASSACVRLNARDAYWIFNNCAIGTEVNIFYDWGYSGPLTPEPIYTIPTDIPQLKGWDPTDLWSGGNPWLYYSAYLSYDTVQLPCYSSVLDLLAALGPTDAYGNDLSNHFYTDGGYNLDYPGTYTTTGHINIGNLSFSFPITIIITEEIATTGDAAEYNDYGEDSGYDSDYGYDTDTGYDTGYDTDYSYETDYGYDAGTGYDTGYDTDYSYESDYGYDADTGYDTGYSYETDDSYDSDYGYEPDYGYDANDTYENDYSNDNYYSEYSDTGDYSEYSEYSESVDYGDDYS